MKKNIIYSVNKEALEITVNLNLENRIALKQCYIKPKYHKYISMHTSKLNLKNPSSSEIRKN